MENRWSDDKATQFIEKYGKRWGQDLAIGLYVQSLIGAEDKLVLHGGGNFSVKTIPYQSSGRTASMQST